MLKRVAFNVRYAMRQFMRHRGFAVTVVLTIALGVGLNTAMFSVIRAVLLEPLAYGDPDRLVVLTRGATPIRYDAARAGAKSYAALGAYGGEESVAFSGDGVPQVLKGARVSANFLEILKVQPVTGRGFQPDEEKGGTPDPLMGVYPLGFDMEPKAEAATLKFYLGLRGGYIGSPMLSALRLVEIPPLPLNLIEIGRLSLIIDCARAVQRVCR